MKEEVQSVNSTVDAIDSMIKDLCENAQEGMGSETEPSRITLVSNLWNVLKKEHDYKVLEEVRNCLLQTQRENNHYEGHIHRPQNVQFVYNVDQPIPCYERETCRADRCSAAAAANSGASGSPHSDGNPESVAKTMANLEEMVEFDKNCNQQLAELLGAEKVLRSQIVTLEGREQAGIELMKEADEMWISMETAYKDKISNSMQRQKVLLNQLREIEQSGKKWRKNKRDLESQLGNLNKTKAEVSNKIISKTKDIRMMSSEISGLQSKIESIRKEAVAVSGSLAPKRKMVKGDLEKIDAEIKKIQEQIDEEKQKKIAKEKENIEVVLAARNNLTQLNKTLLQKKIETENLISKKDSLIQEIHLLTDTSNACKERCNKKLEYVKKEIARMDKIIGEYEMKCVRCHTGVDTHDVRSRCTECPRCQEGRDCYVTDGDICTFDPKDDCVCEMVKKKLLDNIFENMYTVLDKQSQTKAGKCLADEILACLSKSKNGKLNCSTRKIIQEFVLNVIKKNLDTTIVGGAVKTRCEMEPETYSLLMSCLQNIKPKPVPKTDQGTDVKKDPCSRWGGNKECNCPKGPKMCPCQRAPRPSSAPEPCPPGDEDLSTVVTCPTKEGKPCGVECGAREPNNVFTDVSSWIPDPCQQSTCAGYGKNMRAAQCVLGLEPLVELPNDEIPRKYHEEKKSKKKHYKELPVKDTQKGKRRAVKLPALKSRTIPSPSPKEVIVVDNDTSCCEQTKSQTEDFNFGTCDCDSIFPNNTTTYSYLAGDKQVKAVIDNYSDCVENLDKMVRAWDVDSCKKSCSFGQQKTFSNSSVKPKYNREHLYSQTSETFSFEDEDKVPPLKSEMKSSVSHFESSTAGSGTQQYDSQHFIEIKCTDSGNYGIELDTNVLDELEDRAANNHNFPVYISKTNSGHYLLDLEYKRRPDSIKLFTKRTPSGMIALELLKNDAQKLNINDDINKSIKESSSVLIDIFRKDIPNITKDILQRNSMKYDEFDFDCSCPMELEDKLKSESIENDNVTDFDCYCPTDIILKDIEQVHNKRELNKHNQKCVDCRCSFKDLIDNNNITHPIPCNISSQPSLSEKEHFWDSTNILRENLEEYLRETLLKNEKGIRDMHACKAQCFEKACRKVRYEAKTAVIREDFKNTIEEIFENAKEDSETTLEETELDDVLQLEVHCANGVTAPVLAYVSRLTSETTVLDISNINDLGYLATKDEKPALLTKTKNGEYKLYIGLPQIDNREPNSILKRTPSENVLVVVKNPTLRSISVFDYPEAREQFYEVILEGIHENADIPPAVLQLTNSSEYTYIMDKEFMNPQKQRLNSLLDSECYVGFQKRGDGIVIDFSEDCSKNAILIKNSRGDINVIVTKAIDGSVEEKTKFREYLKSITSLDFEIGGKNKVNQVFAIYGIEYRNSERKKETSLEVPSFKLRRTISGNYYAITDKQSNNDFTTSLKSFLKKYITHAPVKKTCSGDIKILLNVDINESSQCALLKISDMGQLHMILDEQSIKKYDEEIVVRFRNEKFKDELMVDDPNELNIYNFKEHIAPYIRLPQIDVRPIEEVWKDENDDNSSFYSVETESVCPQQKFEDIKDNLLEGISCLCDRILQDLSRDSVEDVKASISENLNFDESIDSDYISV